MTDLLQWLHIHRHAGSLQGARRLPRKPGCKAGLAGEGQQQRFGLRSQRHATCRRRRTPFARQFAFLAATIQIEHPARHAEHRHRQCTHQGHDPARQPEEAAGVQRQDAGHDLLGQAPLGISLVAHYCARTRLEGDGVPGAVVRRIGVEIADLHRTCGCRLQIQCCRGESGLRGLLAKARPDCIQLRQRQLLRASLARGAPAGGRSARCRPLDARQRIHAVAIPLVGPVWAGEAGQQQHGQYPGTDHRMQVPQEAPALQRWIEGQPGTPVAGAARPAQIQPAEQQHCPEQRGGARQMPADFAVAESAQSQKAVHRKHAAEEPLAAIARAVHQPAGVGVGIAGLATRAPAPLWRSAGRFLENHPGAAPWIGVQRQPDDLPAG
ncbi:MAG: hypothetical protein QM696_05205 [Steroidobacteraceae bacterium]